MIKRLSEATDLWQHCLPIRGQLWLVSCLTQTSYYDFNILILKIWQPCSSWWLYFCGTYRPCCGTTWISVFAPEKSCADTMTTFFRQTHRGGIPRGLIQTWVPLNTVGSKSRSFWGIVHYTIFALAQKEFGYLQ